MTSTNATSKYLVIDASLAVRLVTPGAHQTTLGGLPRRWNEQGAVVCAPTLWFYETTSALSKLVRHGHMSAEQGRTALALIQSLGITLIPPDKAQAAAAFEWTLRLQRAAAYDSFYLALTETLGGELGTADRRLQNAARVPWVKYI